MLKWSNESVGGFRAYGLYRGFILIGLRKPQYCNVRPREHCGNLTDGTMELSTSNQLSEDVDLGHRLPKLRGSRTLQCPTFCPSTSFKRCCRFV